MECPYHRQETGCTCGPASMKMVLEALGINVEEHDLVKVLRFRHAHRTPTAQLPKIARHFRLRCVVRKEGGIDDIKRLLSKGYFVVVCFFCAHGGFDHYAVVKKVDSKSIHLSDPWFGPDHVYELSYFLEHWHTDPRYENVKGWFCAVRK